MSGKYKELYLARHGETIENKKGIIQGWKGGFLTKNGFLQTATLGLLMLDKGIETIYTGDLNRQLQSTTQANRLINLPQENIYLTKNLRERHFGSADGKKISDTNLSISEIGDIYSKNRTPKLLDIETLDLVDKRTNGLIDLVLSSNAQKIMAMGSGWINSYIVNNLTKEGYILHP